jgi:hypothetical protein
MRGSENALSSVLRYPLNGGSKLSQQRGIEDERAQASNEKEISYGRMSWQNTLVACLTKK